MVDPVAGVLYVQATERVTAWDDVARYEYVAAVPGDWHTEAHARRLGLDGPAVQLVWGGAA